MTGESNNETISGRIDVGFLDKADRLFRNTNDAIFTEVLQNGRRAGATCIDVYIEEVAGDPVTTIVTVEDNGRGITSFQNLLTLGDSNWNAETEAREDPAGMGFFSLCRSEVNVHSGNLSVKIPPKVFLGKATAQVFCVDEHVRGTRLRFTRSSTPASLKAALERVSEFYPVEVRLDGERLPRHDFLEGSLYRETIDGVEIGFAATFTWKAFSRDNNWNFYGSQISEPFDEFDGLISESDPNQVQTIKARFNVVETGRIKLQLPDRRAVIEDEFFKEFRKKARAAAFRFFQTQRHVLSFKLWQEAKSLGIELPEASFLLNSWHAEPQDEFVEDLFGKSAPELLSDLTNVLLVSGTVQNQHTLEGALNSGAVLPCWLFNAKARFEGYSWYDALPKLVASTVLVDDVRYSKWEPTEGERPAKIEIQLAIKQPGKAATVRRLPCVIHVSPEILQDIEFVAIKNSPWDNDGLSGPFPIEEFLAWATFKSSDDSSADSWETQKDSHDDAIQREVNQYFRGPRPALLEILHKTLDWQARYLAEKLDLQEIRYKRPAPGNSNWEIELV